MKRLSLAFLLACAAPALAAPPAPLVTGLKNPESVVAVGDKIYVTEIGEFGKDGDGVVSVVENGKAVPFATGLDDPKGIVAFNKMLFVADKTRIWRIDGKGKAAVHVAAEAFPTPPLFLNDLAIDGRSGVMYVSDSGDLKGAGGAVYSIAPKGGKPKLVVDAAKLPGLNTPNGLALDGEYFLLLADFGTGVLYRVNIADGSHVKLADGFGGADGLTWDHHGKLFISDYKTGKVFGIPKPGEKPMLLAEGFQAAADTCLSVDGKSILVPDMKAGTLTAIPTTMPGWEVDESPLDIKTEVAFPKLKWTGWSNVNDAGQNTPLRPIVLTHANDGGNRVFVATEQGVIHSFPNDQAATETTVFLDIQDRVVYTDKQNEEGFLGLAFHPKYKENGELFVFYTLKGAKLTNVVSRFRRSKDDPTKADPKSEEVLIKFTKPFWNHDGGTIAFGPDGYLYITHGDGGDGGDPLGNGQNTNTLLGKILRIDVDHKADGKNYAIPKDNPFVGKAETKPEIYAYGFRNIWRFAFDRKTGDLWAGDVGQNLYEEINIVHRGGNYGWKLRESWHPFSPKGVDSNKDMIDPVWEYHHDIGKSITGGGVYRGSRLPELDGHYLYGDYISNKLWALKYDKEKKRVVANRPIKDPGTPMLSFGEAEDGELYFLAVSPTGKGIHRFAK
jgi:glucose/arabinose dehydrogenase